MPSIRGKGSFRFDCVGIPIAVHPAPERTVAGLGPCGHPVLRWMASNVAAESDAAGNIKPSKKKSNDRIDGIVAGIMGLGRALVSKARGGLTLISLTR